MKTVNELYFEKNIPNHTSNTIPFWSDKQKKKSQSFKVFTFHFYPTSHDEINSYFTKIFILPLAT